MYPSALVRAANASVGGRASAREDDEDVLVEEEEEEEVEMEVEVGWMGVSAVALFAPEGPGEYPGERNRSAAKERSKSFCEGAEEEDEVLVDDAEPFSSLD